MTTKSSSQLRFLLTNARSLSPKIQSLIMTIEECECDFAVITESWLVDGSTIEEDVIHLEHGTGLGLLYKNRRPLPSGRTAGGGVAFLFNLSTCSFKERKIKKNRFEVLCVAGRSNITRRPIFVFGVYIPPRTLAHELAEICEMITNEITDVKACNKDAVIIISGDLNQRDISPAVEMFEDVTIIRSAPTRGRNCLDVTFSNISDYITEGMITEPLSTAEGIRSDHNCLVYVANIPKERDYEWIKYRARKRTWKATAAFKRDLRSVSWEGLELLSADDMVAAFETKIEELTDRHFPYKTYRVRSNEYPWITHGIRRLTKKRKRLYRHEGKSRRWHEMRETTERMIEESKETFINNIESNSSGDSAYFNAVKRLSSKTAPMKWKVADLFPDDGDSAGKILEYFGSIGDSLPPITEHPEPTTFRTISPGEVMKRIREGKNVKSAVKGDMLPFLVKPCADIIAKPVSIIFNAVLKTARWPKRWKREVITVIPKNKKPSSLAECRNLSCTPRFSKILEGIVLEQLLGEIPRDVCQYGGIKNSGTDHLLIDTWERILTGLDGGDAAVSVLGIDYQKAFNRMGHRECLSQLRRLGASETSCRIVQAFLIDRTSTIKVDENNEAVRRILGGSPQGSVLGCFLYCCTTQQLDVSVPGVPGQVGGAHHDADSGDDEGEPQQESTGLELGEETDEIRIATTIRTGLEEEDEAPGPPAHHPLPALGPVHIQKYIDDTTITEVCPLSTARRHISAANPIEEIRAMGIERSFNGIIRLANDIGMVVNTKKTQLLCLGPNNGYDTRSEIFLESGERICSSDGMKLLGFQFDSTPKMNAQIDLIRAKYRATIWSIFHLRNAGLKGKRLFRLFACFVRPMIENNSPVYHSMITAAQAQELERMQHLAVRICFGGETNARAVMAENGIDTLASRRVCRIDRFIRKNINNPMVKDRWFPRRRECAYGIRNRRGIEETAARTSRLYNSPVSYMRRSANALGL